MCKLMCVCMCIYIRWPFIGHQAAKWFACPTVHSLIVQLQPAGHSGRPPNH